MELTAQMPDHSATRLGERNGQGSSSSPMMQELPGDVRGADGEPNQDTFGFEPVRWDYSGQSPGDVSNTGRLAESLDYGSGLRGIIPLPIMPKNMALPGAILAADPIDALLERTTRRSRVSGQAGVQPPLDTVPSPHALLARHAYSGAKQQDVSPSVVERWQRNPLGDKHLVHPSISQRTIANEHFSQCRALRPITSL